MVNQRRTYFGVEAGGWWMLFVLWLLYAVSFLERYIVTMLIDPIKQDLGLTDLQMGLILGPAFAVCYALATVPLGWAADRFSRRKVIFGGVAIWSLATMSVAVARTFGGLFAARAGVGLGEAALTPSAYSLIADRFPRKRLTIAFAVFQTGVKFGSAAAFIVGGYLLAHAETLGEISLFGHELYRWQFVMLLAGAPGFVLGILVFTFPEPNRSAPPAATPERLLPFLKFRRRLIVQLTIGFTFMSICPVALTTWVPTFISRQYGWTPVEYGTALGIINILAGVTVVLKGGIVDWLFARGMTDAHVRFYCWLLVAMLPVACGAFFVPDARVFLGLYGLLQLVVIPYTFYANAAMTMIVPSALRGRVFAIQLLVFNMVGAATGPVIVGFLTDRVFGDTAKVGQSIALTLGVCMTAALICLWTVLGELRRAVAHANGAQGGGMANP
jgi:MFS family permease